jgi:hypothetical protein
LSSAAEDEERFDFCMTCNQNSLGMQLSAFANPVPGIKKELSLHEISFMKAANPSKFLIKK